MSAAQGRLQDNRSKALSLVIAVFVAIACDQTVAPSPSSLPSVRTSPTDARSAPPNVRALTPAELAEAIRFRQSLGLNADEAYVREVAADPTSAAGVTEFGVPVTSAELNDLRQRRARSNAIVPLVMAYGAKHREDFAGVYIDERHGGLIVAQFVGHLTEHDQALRSAIGQPALLELVPAQFSSDQLSQFMRTVSSDLGWMTTIPARRTALGISLAENSLKMEVSSPHPNASALILAHFGHPTWLSVVSDGTGRDLLQAGRVVVNVFGPNGRPVKGARCIFIPDWNGGPADPFEGNWETDARGRCVVDLQATGYWVRIESFEEGRNEVLAIERAVVLPGEATSLAIHLGSGN